MSEKQDGGPAFPHDNQELGNMHRVACPGMSLRDYFAAAALTGLIPESIPERVVPNSGGKTELQLDVERAYQYADAMLKARDQ